MTSTVATAAPSLTPLRRILLAPFMPSTWLGTLHLVVNLPVGIFWFTVLVTGASLGLGLLITLVGIPILVALGVIVLWGAALERLRVRVFLGVRLENPHRSLAGMTLMQRIRARAREAAFWRDALHLMLRLPVGILTFTLATILVTLPLALVLSPVSAAFVPAPIQLGSHLLDTPGELGLACLAGLVLLVPAAWALRGLAALERLHAVALLGPSPAELAARVGSLQQSRARGADASAAELRRIERDLHDGAQQRLVKVAMDLGLAVERMRTDPASAEPLVREAHEESKRAIAELRDLARGIHPAVLADRGLDAALSSLAARSPVPVDAEVRVDPRPSPVVESAAYFTISEALANVAKHAHATQARVRVERRGAVLHVEVSDNGRGGARIVPGGGLAGLADRLAALDGRLQLDSPDGGPTRLSAEIPCGS